MPTVIQIGAYRIEIHTGREWDSPHVHVVSGGKDVIVSLIKDAVPIVDVNHASATLFSDR